MRINYFAAARAAAGTSYEELSCEALPAGTCPTIAELIKILSNRHTGRTASGMTLAQVLAQCTFLVNGQAAEPQTMLAEADRLDVLPPFAGG